MRGGIGEVGEYCLFRHFLCSAWYVDLAKFTRDPLSTSVHCFDFVDPCGSSGLPFFFFSFWGGFLALMGGDGDGMGWARVYRVGLLLGEAVFMN